MSTATKRSPRAHFRFKGKYVKRLSFCIGGTVIAAWPSQVSPYFQEIKGKRTISDFRFTEQVFSEGELPTTQTDTRRLALRLRKALLRAEQGTRYLSAMRQRERLDLWLAGLPQKPRRKKRKLELSTATGAERHRMDVDKKRKLQPSPAKPSAPPMSVYPYIDLSPSPDEYTQELHRRADLDNAAQAPQVKKKRI